MPSGRFRNPIAPIKPGQPYQHLNLKPQIIKLFEEKINTLQRLQLELKLRILLKYYFSEGQGQKNKTSSHLRFLPPKISALNFRRFAPWGCMSQAESAFLQKRTKKLAHASSLSPLLLLGLYDYKSETRFSTTEVEISKPKFISKF